MKELLRDLRIGNYVTTNNRTDFVGEVIGLYVDGGVHIVRTFNDGVCDDQPEAIETITPIKLDEDWLNKFGFKKCEGENKEGADYFDNGKILILRANGVFYDYFYYDVEIKFVHHLQNICVDFLREELKIISHEDSL